jgi:hypothetical protein
MLRPQRPLYVTDSVDRVKQELAQSSTTPLDALIELASDSSEIVRLEVAKNPHTPRALVATMANDKSALVRAVAASVRDETTS